MNRHGIGAYAVVEAAIAGVACDESGTDIGCGKVRTGAASCREGPEDAMARIFAGPARVFQPGGPCDAVTTKPGAAFMMYPSMAEVQWRRRRFR